MAAVDFNMVFFMQFKSYNLKTDYKSKTGVLLFQVDLPF